MGFFKIKFQNDSRGCSLLRMSLLSVVKVSIFCKTEILIYSAEIIIKSLLKNVSPRKMTDLQSSFTDSSPRQTFLSEEVNRNSLRNRGEERNKNTLWQLQQETRAGQNDIPIAPNLNALHLHFRIFPNEIPHALSLKAALTKSAMV